MKTGKVINNNVISTWDAEGQEIIVMGRGIGYKAKEGDPIDQSRIEKTFRLESPNTMDRFKELLLRLPIEQIDISAEIIGYAREVLNRSLNPNIYITLTDHINFALERYRQNNMFANPLIREVRRFYRAEYLIGEYAIAMIRRDLGVNFPVDEAASIALHIVNAEYDGPMGDTIKITTLIQQVLDEIKSYFQMELDEQSLDFERFIVHLRFLAQSVFTGEHIAQESPQLQQVIASLYPEEAACSRMIRSVIYRNYGHSVTEEEVAYLTLHLKRIRANHKNEKPDRQTGR